MVHTRHGNPGYLGGRGLDGTTARGVRVLHLSDRLSDRGGAYVHLLSLLAELRESHELLLAVGACDPGVAAPCPLRVVPGLEARSAAEVDLATLAREFQPDLVHVHTVVNPVALEWAAGRPALMTVQDHRYFCPTRGKWTRAGGVCREALRPELCADCFDDRPYFLEIMALTERRLQALRRLRCVTLSSYMRGELLQAGLQPEKVSVVPPFVADLDPLAEPNGAPCVLFVGRLVEAKGVRDAALAWRASALELPLVFAGSGPLRAELERGGHEVLGWQPRERLASTYRRARVLLMPSRWQEPFGMAGLEALSLGVPVAAWDSGGVREWHPGGEGLVAWGDVPGLAQAARSLVGQRATPPRADRAALLAALQACYASACA